MMIDWLNERVLVTGGGGFLGRAIIKQLLDLGCGSIRSIGRSPQPELETLGVDVCQGDIRDSAAVLDAADGSTVVFHTAAKAGVWGKREEFLSINKQGTEIVLKACRDAKVRALVHTSSPSVAYPPTRDIENIDESEPMPGSYLAYYPESKALAEQAVLADRTELLATTALRPHLIWGPGDPHLLPRLIQKAKARQLRIVGDGKSLVDLTYVDNAACAHIRAAENLLTSQTANHNVYFISDGEPVNLWRWINQLLDACGLAKVERRISYRTAYWVGALLETAYSLLPLPGEPPMTRFVAGQLAFSHYFNINRAREDFAYVPPVSADDALKSTTEWLKAELLSQ